MDRFDTLEIEGIDKRHTISYDPWTQTHIVGGHGVLFSSHGTVQKAFLSDIKPEANKEEEAKKIQPANLGKDHNPPDCLRFVPNQKSQQLLMSPSGKKFR